MFKSLTKGWWTWTSCESTIEFLRTYGEEMTDVSVTACYIFLLNKTELRFVDKNYNSFK